MAESPSLNTTARRRLRHQRVITVKDNNGQFEFQSRFGQPSDLLLRTQQKFQSLNRNRFEAGLLLCRVVEVEAWSSAYRSFEAYVEDALKISLRTAQQLVKTVRKFEELQIDVAEVAHLGWSKLALVLKDLTDENKEIVLNDVALLSHAELKQKYKKSKQRASKAKNSQLEPDQGQAESLVVLSAVLQQALMKAAVQTKSDDLVTNLNFLATCFLTESYVASAHKDSKSIFPLAKNDPDSAHLN